MAERSLVFIPAYNCEKQITRVLAQFTPAIQARFDEILVIDNGSTDNTRDAALAAMRLITGVKTTLMRNNHNYGLGGSHKVAFHYALEHDYDYCLVLHGDDQGHIGDILPELDRGAHRRFDCLLSSRFMAGSRREGYSRFRIFGNLVFNAILSAVTLRLQSDFGSGLCCFSRSFLASGIYEKASDDLTFNYTLQLLCASNHVTQKFFPASWREDDQISNVRLARQTWRMIKILGRYMFCRQEFLQKGLGNRAFDYTAAVIGGSGGAG